MQKVLSLFFSSFASLHSQKMRKRNSDKVRDRERGKEEREKRRGREREERGEGRRKGEHKRGLC